MGIGYVDSVIVYNRYLSGVMETEYYLGTRFDNVRVELTQGANVRASGIQDSDVCKVKIPNTNLPKPYMAPERWSEQTTDQMLESFTLDSANQNFFVIVKKDDIGVNVNLPVGRVASDEYQGGFYQHVRDRYGYAYAIKTVDVYSLIPRYEVGGR